MREPYFQVNNPNRIELKTNKHGLDHIICKNPKVQAS